jgi:hypothetical protein
MTSQCYACSDVSRRPALLGTITGNFGSLDAGPENVGPESEAPQAP